MTLFCSTFLPLHRVAVMHRPEMETACRPQSGAKLTKLADKGYPRQGVSYPHHRE
jgi:hypothetical protein